MLSFLLLLVIASTRPSAAEAPSFRPFEAPAVLASPGEPTARSGTCVPIDRALPRHEALRESAALDAWLRNSGGALLPTTTLPVPGATGCDRTGAICRGPNGERWLVVPGSHCPGQPRPYALDASGEVFEISGVPKAKVTRSIRWCTVEYWGCGGGPPPLPPPNLAVEVPEGARLGERRWVEFPMDVRVEFLVPVDANGAPMLGSAPP